MIQIQTCHTPTLPPHMWLHSFTQRLQAMIHQKHIVAIRPQENGTWVLLPTWIDLDAKTPAGKKSTAHSIPARINWTLDDAPDQDISLLQISNGQTVQAHWSITSLGYKESGTTTITGGDTNRTVTGHLLPKNVTVDTTQQDTSRHAIKRNIIQKGCDSKWEALQQLAPSVEKSLESVKWTISHEIAGNPDETTTTPTPVLDKIAIQKLRDEMLYGGPTKAGNSNVSRLLDRSLEPDTFKDVDPLHYMAKNIRRDCYHVIGRAIDDPYTTGKRIRNVYRKNENRIRQHLTYQDGVATTASMNSAIDLLVNLYHETYPRPRISRTTALRALTVGATADSQTISFKDPRVA